jgi:hypothetical protein
LKIQDECPWQFKIPTSSGFGSVPWDNLLDQNYGWFTGFNNLRRVQHRYFQAFNIKQKYPCAADIIIDIGFNWYQKGG